MSGSVNSCNANSCRSLQPVANVRNGSGAGFHDVRNRRCTKVAVPG